MYDYPTIIVDSFFKHPLDVREFALNLNYTPNLNGTYSGKRTESLHITYNYFFNNVCKKILNSCLIPFREYSAEMYFHLSSSSAGSTGWVHVDSAYSEIALASIIYLDINNNAIDHGTGIFKLKNLNYNKEKIKIMRKSFVENISNDEDAFIHNQNYTPTVKISNEFNRMITYDPRNNHAGLGYFGDADNNSRLTLLTFFTKINTE
jgi:hypothetical protein